MASLVLVLRFSLFLGAIFSTASTQSTPLTKQCWHESPLSLVGLVCSKDGSHELAVSTRPVKSSEKLSVDTGPWTHEPVCTGFLEALGSQLCVYTNASFSNGRGISIFTTPRVATEIEALAAFQVADALRHINDYSGMWRTQQMTGKGIGMVAKKQLAAKDRITAYTPALIAHHEEALSTMEREKYFRIAVAQLPEATRQNYGQLAFVYGQPQIRVQDIVKANTFQLEIAGKNHLAVFPETSRFNHACAPNAQYYLDHSLLTHFVHATRPIAPGEEITISYTSPLESTDRRQQHLREGFHFTCSCSRCSAKEATDATLDKIQEMQNVLNDWSATSTASPKLAEKLLQLYRKEGLEGFLDIPYGFAALAYNAVGETRKADSFARRAKETILMKDGPWTPNFQIWDDLTSDPKQHWSYKRRRR